MDTAQVLERCMASVIPKDNFLDVMGGSPDLYGMYLFLKLDETATRFVLLTRSFYMDILFLFAGPFWISTTVVFVLFVMSSIIDSIHAYMQTLPYSYDIGHLTFAFATIYTYAFMIPAMIWGATKYYGCQPDLLEMLALYGYGLTIWIPVAFLSVAPWNILRWALILAGGGSSGVFLVRNMYPVLARAEAQTSKAILILVVGLHVALTLILKYKFFSL